MTNYLVCVILLTDASGYCVANYPHDLACRLMIRPDSLPGNENKEEQEEGNFYYMACALHAGSLIIVILLVEQPTVILCSSGSALALFDRDNTVLIGYYDYLGTRPKNSHRPIIVTGR